MNWTDNKKKRLESEKKTSMSRSVEPKKKRGRA